MKHIKLSIDKARTELSKLCNKPSSFTMTVPAREDDSDIVIDRALGYAGEMHDALVEIKNNIYIYKDSDFTIDKIKEILKNLKNLKP